MCVVVLVKIPNMRQSGVCRHCSCAVRSTSANTMGTFRKNRFVFGKWTLVSALLWNLTVNILAP